MSDNQDDSPVVREIQAVLSEAIGTGVNNLLFQFDFRDRRSTVLFQDVGPFSECWGYEDRIMSHAVIIQRLMIMAGMNISQKGTSQSGRINIDDTDFLVAYFSFGSEEEKQCIMIHVQREE